MSEQDTLEATLNTYFGDWEGDDCAVRTDEHGVQRFIITNSAAYNARIAKDREKRQCDADESVARAVAFDAQCG